MPGRKSPSLREMQVLLPTPNAGNFNDGENPEEWLRRREELKALGINGNGMGTPLAMAVRLLPTPGAWLGRRPENATADPERAASRMHDGIRGKRLLELPDALALLPTPTQGDHKASGSRNLVGSKAHMGVSLTDAVRFGNSQTPRTGESTVPPSDAGSESTESQPHVQLTLEDG